MKIMVNGHGDSRWFRICTFTKCVLLYVLVLLMHNYAMTLKLMHMVKLLLYKKSKVYFQMEKYCQAEFCSVWAAVELSGEKNWFKRLEF